LTDFRIFETEQFQKDLKFIARSGMPKMLSKLHKYVYPQLRSNPTAGSNVKRLKGPYSNTYRYRIGAWHFFYTINEERRIVNMIAASHRSRAY
jgi:mRNA-degrading endonuclease RelE of RelBE toxin-antitoxin system